MKDIRPAIVALLLGDPIVSGMVGGNRIYFLKMPQGERRPSVLFERITGRPDMAMDGPTGIFQTQMQFNSIASDSDDAVSLADAVHDRLNGFRGTVSYGGSPDLQVNIQLIMQVREGDLFEDETAMANMRRDFEIWYDHLA